MFDIRLPRGERSFDAPSTFFRRDGGGGEGRGREEGGNANRLGSKIAVMEEFERWEIRKGMGREKTSGKMSRGKRKISNGIKDEKGKGIEKNGRVTREYLKLGGRWEREKGIVISRKFAACRFFRVLYSQRFSIRGEFIDSHDPPTSSIETCPGGNFKTALKRAAQSPGLSCYYLPSSMKDVDQFTNWISKNGACFYHRGIKIE